MNVDFATRGAMMAYSHGRKIVDVDRYARRLLMLGDVFPPDPDGIYLDSDGTCISDFGRCSFYTSKGHRKEIASFEDFDKAVGTIYDHRGNPIVTIRRPGTLQVSSERHPIFRAKNAAAALVGDILRREFGHLTVADNIPDWDNEVIYLDAISESRRRRDIINRLEDDIIVEVVRELEEFSWFEMIFEKSRACHLVDIRLDVRIKEYYENFFNRQEEEEDLRREHGDAYGRIRCT